MLASSIQLKAKYEQPMTPLTYPKNHLKLPNRKLWQEGTSNSALQGDHWNKCKNSNKWDFESPQFVDFSNAPDAKDSFFDKVTVIVSTPNVNFENRKLPNTVGEEDTLIECFDNFSLSGIKHDESTVIMENPDKENKESKEEYVVHKPSVKMGQNNIEKCNKIKKPQKTMINPFTFETRDKIQQQRKQERINKILEEQKKITVFRANPLPNFLKPQHQILNNNQNRNNIDNKRVQRNINEQVNKVRSSVKQVKKNNEVGRKLLTVPRLSNKNLRRPKTPPLRTAIRAQQRKHFDDTIREKERQKEQLKQMEIAATKKREQEELLRLRKETIHKAQPIRKYKLGLPKIEKRPLTDPISPISLKRRRRNA